MHEQQPEIDDEELPPRPRRRMLTPLPLALLALLAIACGFIAGVLVEKGQGGGSASAGPAASGALASRFAALRGGGASGGSASGGSAGGGSAGGGGAGSGAASTSSSATGSATTGSSRGAGAGATIGQVAYVSKGALYVTTLEGNTVKVTAAAGATVTKSVKTSTAGIHPGETVVVTGAARANGAIAAASIRAGAAGAGGFGGAAALLGGSGRSSGASSGAGGASGGSGGGEQALFGKG